MSIKSAILTDLVNKIKTNPSLIDQDTDLYNVLETALNNYYPVEVNETHATTNTITERNLVNTALQYDVKIYKQGRTVFINGFIKNTTAFSVNDYFLTIIGSEYLPSPVSYAGNKYLTNNNLPTTGLSLNTISNRLNGIVPANTTVIFSISYPTLN